MQFISYLKSLEGQAVALSVIEPSAGLTKSYVFLGKLEVQDDFVVLHATLENGKDVPVAIRLEDVRRVAPPEAFACDHEFADDDDDQGQPWVLDDGDIDRLINDTLRDP